MIKPETQLRLALLELIAPIVAPIVERAVLDAFEKITIPQSTPSQATGALPFMSSDQVKAMTGWPDGTFYQKVAQMPEGVVIRGKSKRLLFDREKFVQWLKTPVQP